MSTILAAGIGTEYGCDRLMDYRRILTIQDISCVGQCSTTVALPILSACGQETCVLPTALLSTHTGGFGKPKVLPLDGEMEEIWQHWKENGIGFDAILVGYIGTVSGVNHAIRIIKEALVPGGRCIVDPAMADHGKCYAGLDKAYANAIWQLCQMADVILPNLTEAAIFSGMEYRELPDEGYVSALLERLEHNCVILTGVGYEEGQTGVVLRNGSQQWHYQHRKIGGGYSGTGDIFAATFTGAWMQGKTLEQAVKIAADFTCLCIENTQKEPAHWYGVKFETALPELMRMLTDV